MKIMYYRIFCLNRHFTLTIRLERNPFLINVLLINKREMKKDVVRLKKLLNQMGYKKVIKGSRNV